MTDTCVWKQLIKILLPVTMILFGVALLTDSCSASGENMDLNNKAKNVPYQNEDRSQKVRAKWRGDKFWAEATANLTKLELERDKNLQTSLHSNYTTQARMQSKSQSILMTTTPMAYPAGPTTFRKRSTLHRGKSESTSDTNTKGTTIKTTTSMSSSTPLTTSVPKSRRTTATTKLISKPTKSSKTKKPKTSRPQAFSKLTAAPDHQLDRTTLVADLSPFQEYYLEYTSDEVDEKTTKRPKQALPFVKNVTDFNQTQDLNSTTFKIQFYPKTPVNLLYLLQAYASNMKPIQVQSPIAGAVQTSIPVSVPVRVNPPKSPFLFTLDLDNFFTRMAISFFYSSIAMAPLIYLIVGGLGGLGGLSMVPFTGKKRRRRRRRDVLNYHRFTSVPKHLEDVGIINSSIAQNQKDNHLNIIS